eukprot:TRINITY_DN23979_c0_g1_i1.p1 TRINITY_DN23979_c0_g1~~TRINITY_DN23979_c0_g1_i1.p1  ORF type:complete len:117 (-),score=17.75 TRINITY_DN23979_c0_g1_i1:51-401(-)
MRTARIEEPTSERTRRRKQPTANVVSDGQASAPSQPARAPSSPGAPPSSSAPSSSAPSASSPSHASVTSPEASVAVAASPSKEPGADGECDNPLFAEDVDLELEIAEQSTELERNQ